MQQPTNELIQYAVQHQPKIGEETVYFRLKNGKLTNITFPVQNEYKYSNNQLQQIGTVIFRLKQDSNHYYPYSETELTNIYQYWVKNQLTDHDVISLNTVIANNKGKITNDFVIVGVVGFIVTIILLIFLIRFAFRFWNGKNVTNQLIKARKGGRL